MEMPDSSEKKKYEPLGEYLATLSPGKSDVTLTFKEVEEIIDDTLPRSAFEHREWWANQERGSRAPYWQAAGFKVARADLEKQIVRFERDSRLADQPRKMTLQEVVTEVNRRAHGRPIGGLQEWRREHKGMSRLPSKNVFPTSVELERHYAFHVGGLIEFQFNLGFDGADEERKFRDGIAFSLRTTRELPDIEPLIPKIARFNEFLRVHPDVLNDFEMWNWSPESGRSDNYPVSPIPDTLVRKGCFIFLGRLQPSDEISVRLILDDFDRLLPVYKYVEGTEAFPSRSDTDHRGFTWSPGNKARVTESSFQRQARTVEKALRHNEIQSMLFDYLAKTYGDENASGEQRTGNGTSIDIAVREGKSYVYFEIKTGLSAQSCIREALGQLLEYSYWPGAQKADRLVIVGEADYDDDAKSYIRSLRKTFSLPVEYRQFDMKMRRFV